MPFQTDADGADAHDHVEDVLHEAAAAEEAVAANEDAQDVYADGAAVEHEESMNATAEMLVDEIVNDTVARSHVDVAYSVQPAHEGGGHVEAADAAYEPVHLADAVLAAAHEGAFTEAAPTAHDPEAQAHEAELTAEQPAKLATLENEADVEVHQDAAPTLPSLVEHVESAQRAGSAEVSVSAPKRKRKEFTASEKLQILSELEAPNPPSIKELLAKYGLSKSSFHRWRQEGFKEKLIAMASGEQAPAFSTIASLHHEDLPPSILHRGHKKRDTANAILPLKRAIQNFINHNASLPEDEQYAIRSGFLQVKSRELRNELLLNAEEREREINAWKLNQYQSALTYEEEPQPLLTLNEIKTLKNFKGSKSWSCQIAGQLGLLQQDWSEAAELNSKRYLEEAALAMEGPLLGALDVKKPKKARVEFTAVEKARILKEVDESNVQRKAEGLPVLSVEEICERYGTSKSSLHRWRQHQRSGQLESAVEDGNREVKRIFKDKLMHIKRALVEFVQERGDEGVGYGMLHERAMFVRDELLKQYEAIHELPSNMVVNGRASGAKIANVGDGGDATEGAVQVGVDNLVAAADPVDVSAAVNPTDQHAAAEVQQPATTEANTQSYTSIQITDEEYHHLSHFKASISWLREVAKKYNFIVNNADDKMPKAPRVQYDDFSYYHEQDAGVEQQQLPPLDRQAEEGQQIEAQQEGAIGEEQVEHILDGQEMDEVIVQESSDVKGFVHKFV